MSTNSFLRAVTCVALLHAPLAMASPLTSTTLDVSGFWSGDGAAGTDLSAYFGNANSSLALSMNSGAPRGGAFARAGNLIGSARQIDGDSGACSTGVTGLDAVAATGYAGATVSRPCPADNTTALTSDITSISDPAGSFDAFAVGARYYSMFFDVTGDATETTSLSKTVHVSFDTQLNDDPGFPAFSESVFSYALASFVIYRDGAVLPPGDNAGVAVVGPASGGTDLTVAIDNITVGDRVVYQLLLCTAGAISSTQTADAAALCPQPTVLQSYLATAGGGNVLLFDPLSPAPNAGELIDMEADFAALAHVPLPASVWLLLGGLGMIRRGLIRPTRCAR